MIVLSFKLMIKNKILKEEYTMFINDWNTILNEEINKPYFKQLQVYLQQQYKENTVYPSQEDMFNAFNYTAFEHTKVVIIGQDPYHGREQAEGLSFSVKPGMNIPPSLKNIFKELHSDLECQMPTNGSLLPWAKQGVLLLNTVLTVEAGIPNSHKGLGWELFTDHVISLLNERKKAIVFVLWGKHAQQKRELVTDKKHLIIESAHPSPFSARRGFFGSCPFSKVNDFLRANGEKEIDWCISNEVK